MKNWVEVWEDWSRRHPHEARKTCFGAGYQMGAASVRREQQEDSEHRDQRLIDAWRLLNLSKDNLSGALRSDVKVFLQKPPLGRQSAERQKEEIVRTGGCPVCGETCGNPYHMVDDDGFFAAVSESFAQEELPAWSKAALGIPLEVSATMTVRGGSRNYCFRNDGEHIENLEKPGYCVLCGTWMGDFLDVEGP